MILNRSSKSLDLELGQEKQAAIALVNKRIGEVRLLFITDLPGQEGTYAEKEREAISYIATNPDPNFPGPISEAAYPFTYEECMSVGYTPWEACQLFLNMAAQWRPLGAKLEGIRVGYNNQIQSATDRSTIEQLLEDFDTTIETFTSN